MGVALIEALLLVLLISTAINFMRDSANEALLKRASTAATLFSTTTKDAVLSYDLASLDAFVAEVLKNPDIIYARVLDGQGQVFAEGGQQTVLDSPFSPDSNVDSVNDDIFDIEALITESGETFGKVQLGIGISSINQAMDKIQRWTITIAAVEMALVALFSFVLGIYLTGNLKLLREGAARIASSVSHGEYSQVEVTVPGKDELSDVANAFNKLSVALEIEHSRREGFEQELKELNLTLEQKVESRTALLRQQNKKLEQINHELQSTQQQLVQSEKMASVGQLAAGVAHEINNPIGFVSSNLGSLQDYTETYREIAQTVKDYLNCKDKEKRKTLALSLFQLIRQQDIDYLNEDSADLIKESINGLNRVADIVKSLKQFAHVDTDEKAFFDLNECIRTTINMVNNELKYHCTVHSDLSPLPELPPMPVKLSRC